MPLARARPDRRLLLFAAVAAASLAGLLLLPPIPQDPAYHLFADDRALIGIPNFWNVVSNLPFIAVGAVGLARFRGNAAEIVLFSGFLLIGLGSSYYHWDPNDGTLFWDRLPMTLSFAAILALVVGERIGEQAGGAVLWAMLAIGVGSLVWWRWSDDLRLYFWAQFFPGLALVVLFALYPAKYSKTYYWFIAVGWYALAKVLEFSDHWVYSLGQVVSGHTLKHLAAAMACFVILRYFQLRRPLA